MVARWPRAMAARALTSSSTDALNAQKWLQESVYLVLVRGYGGAGARRSWFLAAFWFTFPCFAS
eukprot:SAG31_NODE_2935_length_4895_cov_5.362177_5_plen_64_part_00